TRIGGQPLPLAGLASALEDVDVLLTSTGSSDVLLDADDVAAVMQEQGGRPLLIFDIAVPRLVDSQDGTCVGVTLLHLDDPKPFACSPTSRGSWRRMAGRRLRAATRGSELARWQTDHVAALLGDDVEVIVVETTGDRRTDVPIHEMGGRGVFVKEVQAAVLDG